MKLDFEQKLSNFDKHRGLKLPDELTEDLAEFMGIMFGDGCSGKYMGKKGSHYIISIAGHSEDDLDYHKNT